MQLFIKKIWFNLLCFAVLTPLYSQQTGIVSLPAEERWLTNEFVKLYGDDQTLDKDSINDQIIIRFENVLKTEESFFYPWPELKMIGKLKSEDQRINIFTWYIEKKRNEFEYFGILQIHDKNAKQGTVRTFILKDTSAELKNPETYELDHMNWYGSLYYGMKSFIYRKKVYYALLGYDFNDEFSDKKLIEILTLSRNLSPVFAGSFQMEIQSIKRVIFEYSAQIAMTLRYDDRLKLIVFDHLSPIQPMFANNYRFYSPDGSYDAFKFERGHFKLVNDVDARNE